MYIIKLFSRDCPYNRLVFIFLACAFLLYSNSGMAQSCNNQKPDIVVGGTVGFESLADPANTARLRATCRVGLYIHAVAWGSLPSDDVRKSILKTFQGSGPASVERGLGADASVHGWDAYKKNFLSLGVNADQAHMNGITHVSLAAWKSYVDAGRSLGVRVVAPIFSPNSGQWKNDSFASSNWDDLRAESQYGGGLTIDSPPHFFLKSAPGYQAFVEDELRWARQAGIEASLIISPNDSGLNFMAETQRMISKLAADGALPTFYIVENYKGGNVPAGYPNVVGSENDPQSITGVALWLAEHIQH